MSSTPIRTLQTVSFLSRQSSSYAEMTHAIIPVHILLENPSKSSLPIVGITLYSSFKIALLSFSINTEANSTTKQKDIVHSKYKYIEDGISFACFLKNYYTLYRKNKNKKDVLIFAIMRDSNEK